LFTLSLLDRPSSPTDSGAVADIILPFGLIGKSRKPDLWTTQASRSTEWRSSV
jgi:hypothetical protein